MAVFTLDAGIFTVALAMAWALRMRVNMSAMGSVMLIDSFPQHRYPEWISVNSCVCLPTGLAQTRHVAAHRRFAQLVAAERELAIHAARAAGQFASIALTGRTRVARQFLQLGLRRRFFLVRGFRAEHDRLQLRALRRVLLHRLRALLFAHDHAGFCHCRRLSEISCGTGSRTLRAALL